MRWGKGRVRGPAEDEPLTCVVGKNCSFLPQSTHRFFNYTYRCEKAYPQERGMPFLLPAPFSKGEPMFLVIRGKLQPIQQEMEIAVIEADLLANLG